MSIDATQWPESLVVRHQPWAAPLLRPRMANDEDIRAGVGLTSRYLTIGGRRVVPVSGELHYSRVPAQRWAERLRQMRAGGITVVSSYVFWIHHVHLRGRPCFSGNLDVAAFVDQCAAAGLEVILRIGPWCHGEVRNGGFPDWVQSASVAHRTDDPAYLTLVAEWFGQLAGALGARCAPTGSVLGIQLENELYDQPEHMLTLKRMARAAGLSAPLWTATAWGTAQLPAEEVLPLYGGYGDGFWADADAPWDATFRSHYFFSDVWDDPGIGADLGPVPRPADLPGREGPCAAAFPAATCELGGGMATAYHRRPRPGALDIAAVAHCKLGNGSAWQGFYMYAGGTNPPGGMQESHASGYPNDLPSLGYDFHAPIGESGDLAPSHAELRRQHAFLAAFGADLVEMPSSLQLRRPEGVEDTATMRMALRSDGQRGFLFLAWHQPHVPLPTYRQAQFLVIDHRGEHRLPSRPVDIPSATLARWPIGLTAGGVRLAWATASALTVLPGQVPTLVLVEDRGIGVEVAIEAGDEQPRIRTVVAGCEPTRISTGTGALDLLVLPAAIAAQIWVCEDGGQRRLLLSDAALRWGPDGRIEATGAGAVTVRCYQPHCRGMVEVPMAPAIPPDTGRSGAGVCGIVAEADATGQWGQTVLEAVVMAEGVRPPDRQVPACYGKHNGRASAPTAETFDRYAAVYRLVLPEWAAKCHNDAVLRIAWAGDVGQFRVDGCIVTDRFWDGSDWLINLRDVGYHAGAEVALHLLPLATGSTVHLPGDARDRLLGAEGQLVAVDEIRLLGRSTWLEQRSPARTGAKQ